MTSTEAFPFVLVESSDQQLAGENTQQGRQLWRQWPHFFLSGQHWVTTCPPDGSYHATYIVTQVTPKLPPLKHSKNLYHNHSCFYFLNSSGKLPYIIAILLYLLQQQNFLKNEKRLSDNET